MAVLAHSAIAGLVPPPESPTGAARLSATNRLRAAARLPQLDRLTEAWTGYTTLVTTIPALDPAAETADGSVHYLGPVFEALPDDAWESPWAAGDDRPLVLVSFSTTGLWDQSGRIRNTLEGLAGESVRVLVSASQAMDLGPIPDNAAIRRAASAGAPWRGAHRHPCWPWNGRRVTRPWGAHRRSAKSGGGSAVSCGASPPARRGPGAGRRVGTDGDP